jgi:hypothetical protein
MPIHVETIAAGSGDLDGTPGLGEIDMPTITGASQTNETELIQFNAIQLNTPDAVNGTHKVSGIHFGAATDLASFNAGVGFVFDFEGDKSHALFSPVQPAFLTAGVKLFVFATIQGVDNFTKTILVAWRRVTRQPDVYGR